METSSYFTLEAAKDKFFNFPTLRPDVITAHREYLVRQLDEKFTAAAANAKRRSKVLLSHKLGLKLIRRYRTPYIWSYPESPVDVRALDLLHQFDGTIATSIENDWHRKHGRLTGVAASLSGYDRSYMRYAQLPDGSHRYLELAFAATERMLGVDASKVSVADVWAYRPERGMASSGLPYLAKKKDILDVIIDDADQLSHLIGSTPEYAFQDYDVPPVIPLVKAVPSLKTKTKTRAIWCYPAVMTCIEAMFAAPLYRKFITDAPSSLYPFMIGKGTFFTARSFVNHVPKECGLLALDFVKGDQQIPPWLIRMAKSLLEKHVDFESRGGVRISPEAGLRVKRVWDYVWWYFVNTPIVFDDVLYRKTGGVPSGSQFTLLAWNVISLVVRSYLMIMLDRHEPSSNSMRVCGDDGVSLTYSRRLISDYLDAARGIGVIFHDAPKSQLAYWPDHPTVQTLSTVFSESMVIGRDPTSLFARAVYPGSFVVTREQSVARILSLSMSTANSVVAFRRFADFCLSVRLNFDAPITFDTDLELKMIHVMRMPYLVGGTLRDVANAYRDTHLSVRLLHQM